MPIEVGSNRISEVIIVNPSTGLPDTSGVSVGVGSGTVVTLLNAVTATGAGSSVQPKAKDRAFQAVGTTTTGTGTATIVIEYSNNNAQWLTAATITLGLSTTAATDGLVLNSPYAYVRGRVTGISGTGATVTLTMGT